MDDSNKLLERFKSVVETLQKLAECAVYLEILKTPFKLCTRGHMMCCSCVKSLKACPSCKAEFSIENPVGVRNLLEALPKFCRFSSSGCQEFVESGSDHETYCGYRPERCRKPSCESVVPVYGMLKHYEDTHPVDLFYGHMVVKKESHSMSWYNFDASKGGRVIITVFLFDCVFWVVAENDIQEEQFKIIFEAAHSINPVEDYYVSVNLKNDKNINYSYSYLLKAFVRKSVNVSNVEGRNNSSDEGKDAEYRELYCMKIPSRELKRFVSAYNTLTFFLTFFKEDQV